MTKKFEELAEEVESSLSQLSACSDSGSLHATIEHLRTVLVSLRYDVDNGNYEGEECDALRQQLLGELEELVKGIAPILQALLGVLGDASNLVLPLLKEWHELGGTIDAARLLLRRYAADNRHVHSLILDTLLYELENER